jgi:hypothetical protein
MPAQRRQQQWVRRDGCYHAAFPTGITFIDYEQMRKVNHVRCANHSIQLVVLKVLTFIKEPTEQLRDALSESAATKSCGSSIASKLR